MNDQNRNGACGCTEALNRLCEYVDSEMSDADLQRLKAHLEQCPECWQALSAERSIRVVLRRSCVEVAPASLRMRVMSQITVRRTGAP